MSATTILFYSFGAIVFILICFIVYQIIVAINKNKRYDRLQISFDNLSNKLHREIEKNKELRIKLNRFIDSDELDSNLRNVLK